MKMKQNQSDLYQRNEFRRKINRELDGLGCMGRGENRRSKRKSGGRK